VYYDVLYRSTDGLAPSNEAYEEEVMSKSAESKPEGRVKTLNEVASVLRISRGSAYEAAKRKEIPTIRIGRRLLVPCEALDKLLSGAGSS